MKCTHCGGSLIRNADGGLQCLACGRESANPPISRPPAVISGTVRPASTATSTATSAAPDCFAAARAELDQLLAAYASAEALRARAELLIRVLQLAGDQNIPTPPWRREKLIPRPSCSVCGRANLPLGGYRRVGKEAICKKCAKVEAA